MATTKGAPVNVRAMISGCACSLRAEHVQIDRSVADSILGALHSAFSGRVILKQL